MNYAKKVVFHEDLKSVDDICQMFEDGIAIKNIYLLCINKKTNNLIDIIESTEFTKGIWNLQDYIVIGMAKGKRNAFSLAKDILVDFYDKKNHLKTNNFRNQYISKSKYRKR